MLTFIHLSDIHFAKGDDESQFDLNQQIRSALLDDLALNPTGSAKYDAVLICGDIAFSGAKTEYDKAKLFLNEVFSRTSLSMKETYVVPGNHDVDRNHVKPTFPLWASHAEIRRNPDRVHWHKIVETQLTKDPAQLLLTPLRTYNDFAQGCGCQTKADALAWQNDFPKQLEFNHTVRLHGLNSALISDEADTPGNLLVSEFQTSHLRSIPGIVNVVMCHHPTDWLMDKSQVRLALRNFAPVALFGHEHNVRINKDEKQIQLFAGAVQPPRNEPDWCPVYHILQIAIEGSLEQPVLKVRVLTREYSNFKFRAWRDENNNEFTEHRVVLPPVTKPRCDIQSPTSLKQQPVVGSAFIMPDNELTIGKADAMRELVVNFFQLSTPLRYQAAFNAGLLRDGDDALDPQVMWAEVFQRATNENSCSIFWEKVAEHSPTIKDKQNPFTHSDNA
ncbi:metallophosphoesterase family protein [Prosthecobacter sp.]|uniref:metallophosphoesterase family protein n=1 Tax=Prosthecobacter sp. TaxID=1965333 RepID=UPI0037836E50